MPLPPNLANSKPDGNKRLDAWYKAGGSLSRSRKYRIKKPKLFPFMASSGREGINPMAILSVVYLLVTIYAGFYFLRQGFSDFGNPPIALTANMELTIAYVKMIGSATAAPSVTQFFLGDSTSVPEPTKSGGGFFSDMVGTPQPLPTAAPSPSPARSGYGQASPPSGVKITVVPSGSRPAPRVQSPYQDFVQPSSGGGGVQVFQVATFQPAYLPTVFIPTVPPVQPSVTAWVVTATPSPTVLAIEVTHEVTPEVTAEFTASVEPSYTPTLLLSPTAENTSTPTTLPSFTPVPTETLFAMETPTLTPTLTATLTPILEVTP